jgi:hypothetical protein
MFEFMQNDGLFPLSFFIKHLEFVLAVMFDSVRDEPNSKNRTKIIPKLNCAARYEFNLLVTMINSSVISLILSLF